MTAPDGRRRRRRGPHGGWLVALLLALPASLGPGLPFAGATPAAAATAGLRVDLTGVTVTGSQPDAVVTVTGRVTNATAAPVHDVRARLWRSPTALRSPDAVERALTADATPAGSAVAARPAHSFAVTPPSGALAPGASAGFTVSGTIADLGLVPDASHWVGADLTGATTVEGAWDVTGAARLLATVPGAAAPHVVTVVVLDSVPRRLRPDLFVDDDLATDLAPGGRLRRLVDLGANPRTTWLVDPALVAEATDMADGYQVLDGDGTRPGAGATAAQEWLAAFRSLSTARGFQTLYARPDLVGRDAAASAVVLDWSLSATSASELLLPVVVLAERVDATALAALDRRSLPVLQPTVPPTAAWWTWQGANVVAALDLDAPLGSPLLGDGAVARASATLARARAAGTQVRLVRSPDAAAIDAAATPDWTVRGGLAALMGRDPQPVAELPATPDAAGALTPALLARLQRLEEGLLAYGSAAPTTGLAEQAAALAAGGASEAWLGDPAGRSAFLDLLERRSGIAKLAQGVSLSVAGTVTLSADNSQFPATIGNGLDDPITVRVVAESENSARLRVEPSDWVTLRPGDRLSALLTAVPAASGVVGVDLHVETPDGVRLTGPVRVTVEATNLGTIGWIIVVGSGLVLVASTGWRLRQMRRRKGNP
nr:hypothetical protein [Propionibacterium sp.]